MASIDLIRASNGSGDAVKATVTNARVISSTTLQVDATTNWPSKFIATVGSVDGTGAFVPATVTVFDGILSGGNIEITSFAPGYTDIGNTPGQIVVLKPTTEWANNVAAVLDVEHNDDGTHAAVTATSLTATAGLTISGGAVSLPAGSLATAALASGSVTNAKLSTTSGEPGGAWTSWSPTFTGFTIGNGTVTARYTLIGKTVHARFHILYGSTTQITGDFGISNPVTAAANAGTGNITPRGQFIAFNGGTIYNGVMGNTSTTATNMRFIVASGTYASLFTAPNSTTPFASATGVEIAGEFTYEAA